MTQIPAPPSQEAADAAHATDWAAFLRKVAPFDSMHPAALTAAAQASAVGIHRAGDLIIDAFATVPTDVFVVVSGDVDLWYDPDRIHRGPDDRFGAGEVFGFSAILTGRTDGPKVIAHNRSTVLRIPAAQAMPAFATDSGARFLARHVAHMHRLTAAPPTYSTVDDLVVTEPLIVTPDRPAAEVAQEMTRRNRPCALVDSTGGYGLITDALLREAVIAEGRPATTPVGDLMVYPAPTTALGRSAAEALIDLLDSPTEFVIVTDPGGRARGVVAARDFVVSPTTTGVSTHEQIRRAVDLDDLIHRSTSVPGMLAGVLEGGLAASRVIAVYSAIVDTIVRRAIALVFERHPDLSADWFTWISLGSNGRREAVPSSDVDAAVAFDNTVPRTDIARCRLAFAEVDRVLQQCGLSVDGHGAVAEREAFSRTNREWRATARQWISAPAENHGVIMTSLLVDGRPIHGDPGLPEVNRVFTELRRHPGTMRLLLEESLSRRARLRSVRAVLTGRGDRFDVKNRALLPVINIARWAALSTGSTELHTPQRLRAAAGSRFLPTEQAHRLIEVFETLQDLRLRYQLELLDEERAPTNILERDRLSAIDRGIVAECVREIAAVQRRMDSVASYTPTSEWGTASERG